MSIPSIEERLKSNLRKLLSLATLKNNEIKAMSGLSFNQRKAISDFDKALLIASLGLRPASAKQIVSHLIQHTYVYWPLIKEGNMTCVYMISREYPKYQASVETIYNTLAEKNKSESPFTEDEEKLFWTVTRGLIKMAIKMCDNKDLDRASLLETAAEWGVVVE